eukprot:6164790-Alexandrium_andersonii.AAC.1
MAVRELAKRVETVTRPGGQVRSGGGRTPSQGSCTYSEDMRNRHCKVAGSLVRSAKRKPNRQSRG